MDTTTTETTQTPETTEVRDENSEDWGDYDEDYTDEQHDAAFGSTVEEYYEQFQEQLNITIL